VIHKYCCVAQSFRVSKSQLQNMVEIIWGHGLDWGYTLFLPQREGRVAFSFGENLQKILQFEGKKWLRWHFGECLECLFRFSTWLFLVYIYLWKMEIGDLSALVERKNYCKVIIQVKVKYVFIPKLSINFKISQFRNFEPI